MLGTMLILVITSCSSSSPEPYTPPPEPNPPPTLMVCLQWDAVIHPDLAGYRIHYGKVSEQYDVEVEVSENDTEVCIVDGSYFIEGACYYFAATAYIDIGEESDFSNEVEWCPMPSGF